MENYFFISIIVISILSLIFYSRSKEKYTYKWWCKKDLNKIKVSQKEMAVHLKGYQIIDIWHFPVSNLEKELDKIQVLIEKANKFFLYEAIWDQKKYKENRIKNPIVKSHLREIPPISKEEWEASKQFGI